MVFFYENEFCSSKEELKGSVIKMLSVTIVKHLNSHSIVCFYIMRCVDFIARLVKKMFHLLDLRIF